MDSNLITAVGIDVSKGKSTVAIRRPGGEIVRKPFTVKHQMRELLTVKANIDTVSERKDRDREIVR